MASTAGSAAKQSPASSTTGCSGNRNANKKQGLPIVLTHAVLAHLQAAHRHAARIGSLAVAEDHCMRVRVGWGVWMGGRLVCSHELADKLLHHPQTAKPSTSLYTTHRRSCACTRWRGRWRACWRLQTHTCTRS